jgi:hypothetical protein
LAECYHFQKQSILAGKGTPAAAQPEADRSAVEDAVSGGSAEHIVETEQRQSLSSAFFSINRVDKLLARNNHKAISNSSTTQGLPIYPAPPVKNIFSVKQFLM